MYVLEQHHGVVNAHRRAAERRLATIAAGRTTADRRESGVEDPRGYGLQRSVARHVEPKSEAELAIRVDPDNPDHHLWNNNGTWFVHYTLTDQVRAWRVRRSLQTRDRREARRRRDALLARLATA
jgi:hypothetical protein